MAEIVSLFYSKSITPRAKREFLNRQSLRLSRWSLIDHFTVVDLVPWPSSECEAEVDLVLIQTSFALLWKLSLKNTSQHKNDWIYLIKQEGLYQNKVIVSPASIYNCKMAYWTNTPVRASICIVWKFVVLINLQCLCNKNEILIKAVCLLIVFSTVCAILIQLHYCSINTNRYISIEWRLREPRKYKNK